MKSKKSGFAAIAITILLSIPPLAFGESESYLVPVKIRKADRAEIKGYIVFHEEEILRMGSDASSRKLQDPSKLLEFELIKFMEGGSELYISYRYQKEPLVTGNFFLRKGIQFTTDRLNPDVLSQFLAPGEIRWIERTGRPRKIQ